MQFLKKFTNQENKPEHFFALNLSDEKVQAVVWQVNLGRTELVKEGKSEAWDSKTNESLLKAADRSLSLSSEGVKPEPNRVIFGLPETWTEKEMINQDKKELIKALCEELELKPLGFVVIDAAIAAYLKIEEGTPLSAVLVQLSSSEINLTLIKLGKIVGSQLVGRSGDLGADTEEGLSRFDKIDTLPARIILFNGGGDFEEDKQQLLSYDWEDKLPFIHFPRVESLSGATVVKAVALAGGSEVAQSLGIEVKVPENKTGPELEEAAKLGFVSGQDVAMSIKEKVEVSEKKNEPIQEKAKLRPQLNWRPIMKKVSRVFSGFSGFSRSRWLLILAGGLASLLIGLFLLYWYLPKATVTIYLEPQLVDEELILQLEAEGVTDPIKAVLSAQSVEKSVSGDISEPTTGTATIGDPAQGKIMIYNKTSSSKTFNSQTVLLGPDNLAYYLNEDTVAASRSAEEDSEGVITITPGKAEAEVTAVNIGPESNLAADTRLSFKQYSEDDYYAKTDGLAGGTAEEVRAVAEADINNLEQKLTSDLIDKAKAELQQSLGQEQTLVESADSLVLTDKKYSHKVDEAADRLTLEGQLDFKGYVYRRSDLDLLLKEAIKNQIPENFIISEFAEIDLGEVVKQELPVSYRVKLLPRLDLNEIKKNLVGRYPDKVEDYLTSLPRFTGADIRISPSLPKFLKILPRVTKNIYLEIKSTL